MKTTPKQQVTAVVDAVFSEMGMVPRDGVVGAIERHGAFTHLERVVERNDAIPNEEIEALAAYRRSALASRIAAATDSEVMNSLFQAHKEGR